MPVSYLSVDACYLLSVTIQERFDYGSQPLELLHGTWVPELGKICIWAEHDEMRYAPVLPDAEKNRETVTLLLPTYNKKILPSLTMARHLDVIYPETAEITCEPYEQICTALTSPAFKDMMLAMEKENTGDTRDGNKKGDQREDVHVAPDLLFWQQMLGHLDAIFDKNFYIPAITENDDPCWITAYPFTKELATFMPTICCYSNGQYYDPESLLRHFFDFTVNVVVQSTVLPRSTEKQIEGTFLGHYFSHQQKTPFSKEDVNDWMIWKSALDQEKHPLCFKLEAPDHAQKTWTLQCLAQESEGSSSIPLEKGWRDYLMDLGIALRIYPAFEAAFAHDRIQPMTLSMTEAQTFLKETAWILQSAGFPVMIPSWYTPQYGQTETNTTIVIKKHVTRTAVFVGGSSDGIQCEFVFRRTRYNT